MKTVEETTMVEVVPGEPDSVMGRSRVLLPVGFMAQSLKYLLIQDQKTVRVGRTSR